MEARQYTRVVKRILHPRGFRIGRTRRRVAVSSRVFGKCKRCGVQAIAKAGWLRAILEEMPQVAAAAGTANFDADHPVAGVPDIRDVFRVERCIETRPTGVRFELGRGAEE